MIIFVSSSSSRFLCLLLYLYPFSLHIAFVVLNIFRTR